MKKNQLLFLLFVILSHSIAFTQTPFVKEKRDYIWLTGYSSSPNLQTFGGTRFDFNFSHPQLSYEFRELNFDITNASICDTSGNLLFYTNGIEIHNAQGIQMENGGGLNPDLSTQEWADRGYHLYQGALILPVPDSSGLYYLLHGERTTFPQGIFGNYRIVAKLYHSNIDMNSPAGLVTIKNQVLISDTLDFGKITASRHANGRDWWVLQQEYFTNRFYVLSVSPSGISVENSQAVGQATPSGLGQAVFSPDGSIYATYSGHDISAGQFVNIYHFDRCTGMLFDIAQINDPAFAFSGGVAISPNSRFLYVSSYTYVYQYDLWADDIEASRETVAVYDGFQSPAPLATTFFLCQLAPDGKIYISAPNTVRYLHVIHNPNGQGADCQMEQHGVLLPTYNAFGIPNAPYYGLGPEDGSPCDTLGIDHYPKADFRHAEQALTASFWDYSLFFPTQWHWDFGDGSAGSTEQDPVHTYAAPGIYEVCLTVSNANASASDTYCDPVLLIASSTDNHDPIAARVKVYPNPATDYVVIEPQQRLPSGAFWSLRDALGRELRRAALPEGQPQLVLNLEGLPAGLYVCSIEAGGRLFWQGKILKM